MADGTSSTEPITDRAHRSPATDSVLDDPPVPVATGPVTQVPAWLDRSASWGWRIVAAGAGVATIALLVVWLRIVVVPALVALLFASLLARPAHWLKRKGVPTIVATLGVLAALAAVVLGTIALASWFIAEELTGNDLEVSAVRADVEEWLETGPFDLSAGQIDDLEQRARDAVVSGASSAGLSNARLLFEIVTGLFVAVMLLFFFVKDGPEMWAWLVGHVHPDRRDAVDRAGRRAIGTAGQYVKGLAITGFLDALFIAIGLFLIGVPLVVPLAILTFFAAFLPVVGATLAGAVAAIVALTLNGPLDALLVVGLVILVQNLEGDVIMPAVMGRQVPLHPAVILAALTAGGAVAGIVGALLAVPLTAVVVTAVSVLRAEETAGSPHQTAPPLEDTGPTE